MVHCCCRRLLLFGRGTLWAERGHLHGLEPSGRCANLLEYADWRCLLCGHLRRTLIDGFDLISDITNYL